MTIKQQGGIFGRNPTFNNVTVDGVLEVDHIVEKTGAAGITLDGVTLKDGNVVLANGNGIDFSATAGTGTSELFNDYEEGTFVPTVSSGAGTITSYTVNGALYTKIGRTVFVNVDITITNAGTGSGTLNVSLPFTNGAIICNGTGRENALTGAQLQTRVLASVATMNVQTYANSTVIATNAQVKAMIFYFV